MFLIDPRRPADPRPRPRRVRRSSGWGSVEPPPIGLVIVAVFVGGAALVVVFPKIGAGVIVGTLLLFAGGRIRRR